MKLLIAEKPSVALKNYRELLENAEGESFVSKDGYLLGKNWIITWVYGHLVEMEYPEAYGWTDWNVLPMFPKEWKYKTKSGAEKQFKIIQGLMAKSTEIVNGTDAGREGELIYGLLKDQCPTGAIEKRLWVNSYVLKDMLKGWSNLIPRSSDRFQNLFSAALARAKADWLVGMNFSRGYILKTGVHKLSVGRVQTPSLALIVNRDNEVENWKEKFFSELYCFWNGIEFKYADERGVSDFDTSDKLRSVLNECMDHLALLIEKSVTSKSNFCPKPFNLINLQKAGNNKYGYTAQEILDSAQRLYEAKLITYPRTDSEYLPKNMHDEAVDILSKVSSNKEKEVLRMSSESFSFFNDSKVTDHYALIPTGLEIGSISGVDKDVYELIRLRFVMAFSKPYKYDQTDLVIDCNSHSFKTNLKAVTDWGYKAIFNDDDEDEDGFKLYDGPELSEGMKSVVDGLRIDTKKRTLPKYFTEATLLTAMEHAGRLIEDEELSNAIKKKGLGTSVTRSGIIELLKRKEYVHKKGNFLISTTKGRELIKIVDERVSSPEMTGEWEYKLIQVENGELDSRAFLSEIEAYITELCKTFSAKVEMNVTTGNETKCPKCSSVLKVNDYGMFCNDTCGLKLFRTFAGKKLSDKVLSILLSGKPTPLIKGFKSKKGTKFETKLQLKEGKIEFVK